MTNTELNLTELRARSDQAWKAFDAAQRLSQATWAASENAHAEFQTALRRIEDDHDNA
jgi:hypothetical protein